ncbi:ribbon-helix-helix domain-containing protein [Microcoleus sp. herbarium2]|uniref:ribbon-helix-helix domain-containing protein n=1 Tax=Microcoleus sp. herbarium2 TaxID=3055433 RepID=UPI002FD6E34E
MMRSTIQETDVATDKPRTTIYLEPELFQALERRAKEEKRSMSNLCNLLLEQEMKIWLDNNPENPPEAKPSTARTKATTATKATAKTKQSRASTRSK